MYADWQPLKWETKGFKDTFILDGEAVENITVVLDDHLIKTQTMKGSPYAQFIIDEITEWEEKLDRTSNFLDYWLKV